MADGWEHYLTDYNEGLGLVYERFILNDYLQNLVRRHGISEAVEAPLYGMAGVSGINCVELARHGCRVTLVDDHEARLSGVRRIWSELGLAAEFVHSPAMRSLPFADASFDLAWQWAGLWYLADAEALLRELCRVSRHLVFVAMPNPLQPGYLMRKHWVDKGFYHQIDERWTDMRLVRRVIEGQGYRVIETGIMDVPPWPDTVMPVAELLPRLGIHSRRLQERFRGDSWQWSTMDYYLGRQPGLRAVVMRHAWLERSPLPAVLKSFWAHHRYVLARR